MNFLKLQIYEFEYELHSQYIRMNIQTQFHEKNRRFVVSKFVKLFDELIKQQQKNWPMKNRKF